MTHYYLHVGASTLPRAGGEPLTLAQAMHRADGHRYAVVYRYTGECPYKLHRASVKAELRTAKILERLAIEDVSDDDVDTALHEA